MTALEQVDVNNVTGTELYETEKAQAIHAEATTYQLYQFALIKELRKRNITREEFDYLKGCSKSAEKFIKEVSREG